METTHQSRFEYPPGQISFRRFQNAIGREPKDQELSQVNCPLAGTAGHEMCGWNKKRNAPVFSVGLDDEADRLIPGDTP